MRGLEAWVTSVVEDKDVAKVLVLARSLREAITTKHLVVLASPTLELKNKNILAKAFDQVFSLDYHAVNGWIGLKEYAKLSCFNLTLFRKCVYLSPETLVVKNCDEIFDSCSDDFMAVVREDGVDTSVFCFVPSNSVFEKLVAAGKKNHGTKGQDPFNTYMKDWLINQKRFGKLDEKYNFRTDSNSGSLRDWAIIQMPRDFSKGSSKTLVLDGILESTISKHMSTMHEESAKCLKANEVLDSGDSHAPVSTSFDATDSIAIVGLSCRHPGANNFDEFWKLLIDGREGTRQVPSDRWTKEHGSKVDASYQNTFGGFLSQPIDEFDNKLFGISPKEMEFLDPQQRLLLEVTWEALENASIDPLSLNKTHTGVFVGAWMHDYKDLLERSGCEEFYRMYMGNSFGAAAARISFFLQLTGPSVATESGCSSAMVAVDLACKSLRNGETPLALACGVNLLLCPFSKDTMSFVIAPDGRCKTFDESADGFGRAEGCGVLVLKRYADAVKDGDNIWALIKGSSCVQEGVSRSMGTPTKECEALAMSLALKEAGVNPNDVSFVEAHGTGTSLGDPLEISAISEVYGKNRTEPLIIGSVKTNIGHTESCSGITGIIKVIASLQNEMIPPHLNLKTLNPKINLEEIPAVIPLKTLAWPKNKNGKPRLAGVSSFGITGTDGHLIIQETPESSTRSVICESVTRPLHIMKLSAKSDEALDALLSQYQAFLENETEQKQYKFADIVHTANVGRATFNHRAVIIAKDSEEAFKLIQSKKYERNDAPDSQPGKLCFLFTGQGSQYAGMAKQLYEHSPVFRADFDRCQQILAEMFHLDMKEALWGSNSTSLLTRSLYSQTAIFCVEYCLLKLWECWGIKPDYVIGHSLGEFAAAVAANILSLEDAVKLVAERSQLVDSLPKGKMLVLKATKSSVEATLQEYSASNPNFWLDFAAVNSDEQTVLAGSIEAVEKFASYCSEKKNIKTHILDASHAFHSRLMNPILEKYRKIVETTKKTTAQSDKCRYISGVYGKLIQEDDTSMYSSQYWIDHTREMVNFTGACEAAISEGCKYFLEIGPQPVLSALMMANASGGVLHCLPSLRRSEDNWKSMLTTLGKLYLMGWSVDWKNFDRYYSRTKLRLPTYPFQRKKYWFDAVNMASHSGRISNSIHPLLGAVFSNASAAKIFQSAIDLKKVEYIKDHCVGKRIIFPATAFLEICLAAGHCTTEGLVDTFCRPCGPLTIENLKINSPLALDEKHVSQLQVVIDPKFEEVSDANSSTGTKVEVFRQHVMEDEAPKWTQHVVSYFTPAPVEFNEIAFRDAFNLAQIKESCQAETAISNLYAKLSELGLKFGPNFQSLEKIWKGEEGLLASVKVPSDFKDYIVHPVVLDAMLQMAMITEKKGQDMEKLHVPVGIRKFTWLDNTDSDKFYIYSCFDKSGTCSTKGEEIVSVLFDEHGKTIAFMSGMEFVETSVQAMESLLESQETELPPVQQEVWKPQLGHNQSRVEIWETFHKNMFSNEMITFFKESNIISKSDLDKEELFEILCFGHIANAFQELGWNPTVGQKYCLDKLIMDLQILPQYRKLIRYHMTVFQGQGILTFLSDTEIEILKLLPTSLEAQQMIQQARKTLETYDGVRNMVQMYVSCGTQFASILQGRESALRILFPEDRSKPSVEQFYTEAYSYTGMDQKVVNNFKHLFVDSSKQNRGIMRILEVGAGTGNFTGGILKLIMERGLDVEYTFTDISPAFFISAQKKFEEHKDYVKYQVLNLEEDAKLQGFSPGYFDTIFGADVIHTTRDLKDSLSNLRQLLKPSGFLCLIEGAKANHITSLFGLLDGYWRFVDTDIRKHHPLVNGETWTKLCLNSEFDKAVAIPCCADYYTFVLARASEQQVKIDRPITYSKAGKWLVLVNHDRIAENLLKTLSLYRETVEVWKSSNYVESEDGSYRGINVNNKEHMIKLFSSVRGHNNANSIEGIVYMWGLAAGKVEQDEIAQPLLHLFQSIAELKHQAPPKVFIITKGNNPIGDHLCENPAAGTLVGIAKSCANELNLMTKVIDICPDEDPCDSAQDLFFELWNDSGMDGLLAYRKKTRYCGKIMKTKLTEKALKLPQCERFQLVLPQSKAISDLKFGTLGKFSLKPHEIEVQVKAAALNFRDVFAVMKPDVQFEKINVVGSDFAGVVSSVGSQVTKWNVGDAVLGCNLEDGALPSHVRIVEDAVVKMPSKFTFSEAATLPAVFATAYYSLVTVAQMKRGETVLIHTASGGVGLSAIQIARQVGANIIATAGSTRKRAYLRNLGIEHVFHSRNTNYELDIMTATGGKGVDIVLNSLTGPGFKEASLNVCNKNARFIEMSKLSIWRPEEVKELRPDVQYTIVDLTSVSQDIWCMLFNTLDQFLHNGLVKPIPYVRFDGVLIREALTYLQKAKHIGKIVCIMPEIKFQAGHFTAHTPLFNEESTYLITGGLGGIGLEVVKWMASEGAKHLVIISRSKPNEKHLQIINSLRSENKNIVTKAVDVGDYSMCKAVIDFIQDPLSNLPPLRGVMHCAGVLSDATLINQSWDKFLCTFRPKVKGSWHLHQLTASCNLEHFVLFSSMASLLGPPGQSNHSAGNAYLDALAHYRDTIGLPALTINWGQWGQVGVAAGKEVRGVMPFSSRRGIATLEAAMKSQRTQICVVNLDLSVLVKIYPQTKAYLQHLLSSSASDGAQMTGIKSEKFWEDVDSANEEDKLGVIKQYIKILLRQILKLDDEESIDDHSNFQDMGLDSLMMIELKNNLQTVLGSRMTVSNSALSDCHTIELLAERLFSQMSDDGSELDSDKSPVCKLNQEEMRKLIEEDSKLPDNIRAVEGLPLKSLSEATHFLLTGLTGNLGPYMLRDLFKYPQVEMVYCLVRKSSNPTQKVSKLLKESNLDGEVYMSKVKIIVGNVAHPKFGLEDEEYKSLSRQVDAVIHCAVKSNHVETYGMSEMRRVNVTGTLNILEFACQNKTKHVFHSSSMISVASTNEDGCLSEAWPKEDELIGVTDLGYPISKMICDKLIHQATGRGIPCKSFRFGGLIGNSETGRLKLQNSHIMLRFLCYMKLGAMPSVPVPAIVLPVDIAAGTSLKIFFDENTAQTSDIYNIFHPNPALEQEFPVLAKEFGYDVDVVEYGEFVNRFSTEGEDSILYPFKELYENEERYNSLLTFPDALRKWLENPDEFFSVKKVSKVVPEYVPSLQPTWDYVRKNLNFVKGKGLFQKFKLTK